MINMYLYTPCHRCKANRFFFYFNTGNFTIRTFGCTLTNTSTKADVPQT